MPLQPQLTSQFLTRNERRNRHEVKGVIRLTLKILRQLGIGVPKPRRLLSYHLELVRTWES
jgi:hypothetical protein